MNIQAVRSLLHEHPAARRLIEIAERGVTEGRTTVDQLIEDGELSRRQAITVLRDFAEAGCGEFKVGRKGHPSRLEWSVDPVGLARRLVEDPEELDVSEAGAGAAEAEAEVEVEVEVEVEHSSKAAPGPDGGADAPPVQVSLGLPRAPSDAAELGVIEHRYVLRPDLRVHLRLPGDLTRREAEVLADWVRNLSFER